MQFREAGGIPGRKSSSKTNISGNAADPFDGFTGVLKRVEDSVHYLYASYLSVQFAGGAVSIPHTREGKSSSQERF